MQGDAFERGPLLVVDKHHVPEPETFGIRVENHGFELEQCRSTYLLHITDVRFDCIDRATRLLEVLNAYPEVILQDPGGVTERNQIIGLVQVAIGVEPLFAYRLGMQFQHAHMGYPRLGQQ